MSLRQNYEIVMRNLHGPFVFLTLVRLAETPMFTRVDWSTVMLRQRNSFQSPSSDEVCTAELRLAHRRKRTASFEADSRK
jgi:hypothetical protein